MKYNIRLHIVIAILLFFNYCKAIFPEFNDQLMYEINWKDPVTTLWDKTDMRERIYATTKENEKYQCALPIIQPENSREFDISDGTSPEILLSDVLLGDMKKCSYRLEPFWTYELCHGKKITQYHEEKNAEGGISRTEFFLGQITKDEIHNILSNPKASETSLDGKRTVPTRRIEEKETPYYSVKMDNGSPCELNSKPRKTTIIYICHPTSNNEILSVKEVTTCDYEVIVLTPTLCANPAYQVKTKPSQSIECLAVEGSPRYPMSLDNHEKDEIKRKFLVQIPLDATALNQQKDSPHRTIVKPAIDETINTKFLKGVYCLIGGSGWWQYEFCNGRHVIQFHEEYGQPKTLIKLGFWNEQKHHEYFKLKKIKPKTKKYVLHFYSSGDTCDITGKPRQAVVKLICREGSGQQLSIYMTEDEICKYTIGVESPILCPLIEKADENGLFEKVP